MESWLTSSVEARESASARDNMGCTELSSCCCAELGVPLDWDIGFRESRDNMGCMELSSSSCAEIGAPIK